MGFYRGPKIVTDGLVFALDAANTKSYPGSGTTIKNIVYPTDTATLYNSPVINSESTKYLEFDGTNDYMRVESTVNLKSMFLLLYKVDVGPSSWKYLLDARPGYSVGYFANNGTGTWNNFYVNGKSAYAAWTSLPSEEWFTLYIEADNNYSCSTINFFSRYTNTEQIQSKLSTASIYSRALSSSEIQQNHNATKSRFDF